MNSEDDARRQEMATGAHATTDDRGEGRAGANLARPRR